jgi:hypothetical protein
MSSCQNSFIGGVVRTEAGAGCRRTLLPVGEPIWERLQSVPGGLSQNCAAFGGTSGSVCNPSPAACRSTALPLAAHRGASAIRPRRPCAAGTGSSEKAAQKRAEA